MRADLSYLSDSFIIEELITGVTHLYYILALHTTVK